MFTCVRFVSSVVSIGSVSVRYTKIPLFCKLTGQPAPRTFHGSWWVCLSDYTAVVIIRANCSILRYLDLSLSLSLSLFYLLPYLHYTTL